MTLGMVILFAGWSVRTKAIDGARQQAISQAQSAGNTVRLELEQALTIARTLAESLGAVKNKNHPARIDRASEEFAAQAREMDEIVGFLAGIVYGGANGYRV